MLTSISTPLKLRFLDASMSKFALRSTILFVAVTFLVTTFLCYQSLHDETVSRWNGAQPQANDHLLCVLVPFRDCEKELITLVPSLSEFLYNQSVAHQILVLNQTDSYRFNRASLINVGWYEADRLGCDYLVMHDVDIVPLNPALSYHYPGRGVVRHISAGDYHPIKRYNYPKFIGGVLMLTIEDYRRVNGMSNKYWGWGLEDDEFFMRMKEANLTNNIERPKNLSTNRSNTFRHIHGKERTRDYATYDKQRTMSRQRDRVSGLRSVRYEIVAREIRSFDAGARAICLHINLHCDRAWTPFCEAKKY